MSNPPFVDEMILQPGTRSLLQYLKQSIPGAHSNLQERFTGLAYHIVSLGDGPETTVALRKLLECKDATARAVR